jgi:penicillin amidase
MTGVDWAGAVPQMDGELRVAGLQAPLRIRRDAFGIAHVRAENEHDAWFGQGYVAAQDRLWQMEFDRLRAQGRWAEAAGPPGVSVDMLSRRMRLADAAKADVTIMTPGTRAMFEAFAAGVNAFLHSGQPLPVEYGLTGIAPEPWQPWHSVAAFKIRHVHMGAWQGKLNAARLLLKAGPDAMARLPGGTPRGSALILPPGAHFEALLEQAGADLAAAEHLGFLEGSEGGSNSWVVHGSRTTSGMPVVCNDSHRALDVPNAYWQVHVACPEFDVTGATFPSLPGFPHFGHNGAVAWNITHTQADYQDLYIEDFDPATPGRYRVPGGWQDAEHRAETIRVRGAGDVQIETWQTRHGPIIHCDPRSGPALAFRYTATDGPIPAFEALRPMLLARTVAELHASQRDWVDPVNNLVSADTSGNIGYLCRGRLPVRSSAAHRHLPVPGWDGECEWTGFVPFEEHPQAINPPEGFIATANQRVIEGDEPYIGTHFAPPARAERLVELFGRTGTFTPGAIAAVQGDTVSRPARAWAALLNRIGPFTGEAEACRARLAAWDGDLLPASPEAVAYAVFRREAARAIFEPLIGSTGWAFVTSEENAALGRLPASWMAATLAGLDGEYRERAPNGSVWGELLPGVLERAWRGSEGMTRRWAEVHGTNAKHPLSGAFPEHAVTLNQPRAMFGGDGDTVQNAAYTWASRATFDVTVTSVYRQVVDLGDIAHGSFVIPGGASGLPGTPHYADQVERWRNHDRVPMLYREDEVEAGAVHRLTLTPA